MNYANISSKLLPLGLMCIFFTSQAMAASIIGRGGGDQVSANLIEQDGWRTMRAQIFSRPLSCIHTNLKYTDTTDGTVVFAGTVYGYQTTDGVGNPICLLDNFINNNAGVPGQWTVTGTVDGRSYSVSGAMNACLISGTQMRVAEHTGVSDFFYSITDSEIAYALTEGYQARASTFSVETDPSPTSKAFKRFYKGAPQTEHFYTSIDGEVSYVVANGYTLEGTEGYVYAVQKPNTVPLSRWSKFNGATGDLQHFYSGHGEQPPASGWTYEGVAGYACN